MVQKLRTSRETAMGRMGIEPKPFKSIEETKDPFGITRQRMRKAFEVLKAHGEKINPEFEERLMNMDVSAERKFTVKGVGEVTGMRCHHLEIEGLICKGGNRFDPNLTKDQDRALAFTQTPKNLMAGLPYTGSKGGARINPKELEDSKVRAVSNAWVNTFMDMIGPNIDVPAGDWGVSERENDWMTEQYRDNLMYIATAAVTGYTVTIGRYKARGVDYEEHEHKISYDRKKALEYFRRNVGLDGKYVSPDSDVLKRISEDAEFAMMFARPAFTGKSPAMGGHKVRSGATGRGMLVQALEAAKYLYREGRWRTDEGIKLSEDQETLLNMYVRFHLVEGKIGERDLWSRIIAEKKEDMREIERTLFRDATLVVTGAGKVSLGVIKHFHDLDCGIKLLGISDIHGAIKNTEGGLDVNEILEIKEEGDRPLSGCNSGEATNQKDILRLKCTVLASGTPEFAYIDGETAKLIDTTLHLQGTNGSNTPAGDKVFREKGTFNMNDVMNNAGGVTGSGLEWARNLHAIRKYINHELRGHIDGLGLEVVDSQVTDHSMYHTLDRLMVRDFWETLRTSIKYKTDLGTANRINTIFYLRELMERQEEHERISRKEDLDKRLESGGYHIVKTDKL